MVAIRETFERKARKSEGTSDIPVARLCRAIGASHEVMRRYRSERREIVRQMMGSHWSADGAYKPVPLNLLAIYAGIIGRSLIAKEPRVMFSTHDRKAKPVVDTMQSWMNTRIEQIGLAETLQRWVQDALISVGVIKVALCSPAEAALSSFNAPAGQPFADNVSLDDFCYDFGASRFRDAGWMTHRTRVPLVAAKDYYGKKGKRLIPSELSSYNQGTGEERTSNLGRGSQAQADEFEDMTDIWEVWLPRHRKIVCLAGTDSGEPSDEPLEIKPWLGPPCGPFHFLAYQLAPDNAMGKGPILDLVDLHLCVNRLLRKLMAQAERQKTNMAVRGGSLDDTGRLIQSADGEALKYEGDPPAILDWGGPNPGNVQYVEVLRNLFSWGAGNLDVMGGLSPQSKTLGQDQMLNANASLSIADKQDITTRGVSKVLEALGWFWYHHPKQVMKTKWNPPGLPEVSTVRRLHPYNPRSPEFPMLRQSGAMMREVPWEDLDLRVDPHSIRHQSPQQRAQELIGLVKEVVLPMMPLAQQQGIGLDLNRFLATIGKLRDQPDLAEIVTIMEPPQQEGVAPPEAGGMPQSTERTYTRRSMGGADSQGSVQNEASNFFAAEAAAPQE